MAVRLSAPKARSEASMYSETEILRREGLRLRMTVQALTGGAKSPPSSARNPLR